MIILRELLIIFSIVIAGDLIASLLPIPIPGNILGMLLLLILLWKKILVPEKIRHVSQFLLVNMAFFFIPAGVGVMKNIHLIEGRIVQVLFICIVSTVITFGVTGLTAQGVIKYQEKKKGEKNERSI